MWAVRVVSQTQYHEQSSNLSSHQKTWLRSELAEQRENEAQWLDTLVHEISRWFSRRYEKVLGKQAVKLGEEERLLFANSVEQNREFLI
jgi:CRISPR-associated protein Csy1